MKQKKLRLSLNKQTIANLSFTKMKTVRGGTGPSDMVSMCCTDLTLCQINSACSLTPYGCTAPHICNDDETPDLE
jgi:hypothetical protein